MQFPDICSKEQLIFVANFAQNTSVKLTESDSLPAETHQASYKNVLKRISFTVLGIPKNVTFQDHSVSSFV